MSTIEITKKNAISAYRLADKKGKELLESLLGIENVLPGKITDRIKTFDDVLNELGDNVTQDVKDILNYKTTDPDMISARAYIQIALIARALNEGWVPNWEDSNEYKYMPWFKHKAGFGLSYVGYDVWATGTIVGSRLCFKSAELAEYAGTQFADIYNDYLTIK